jgi:hypothetical protein
LRRTEAVVYPRDMVMVMVIGQMEWGDMGPSSSEECDQVVCSFEGLIRDISDGVIGVWLVAGVAVACLSLVSVRVIAEIGLGLTN